jgi:hypothetical protein
MIIIIPFKESMLNINVFDSPFEKFEKSRMEIDFGFEFINDSFINNWFEFL